MPCLAMLCRLMKIVPYLPLFGLMILSSFISSYVSVNVNIKCCGNLIHTCYIYLYIIWTKLFQKMICNKCTLPEVQSQGVIRFIQRHTFSNRCFAVRSIIKEKAHCNRWNALSTSQIDWFPAGIELSPFHWTNYIKHSSLIWLERIPVYY